MRLIIDSKTIKDDQKSNNLTVELTDRLRGSNNKIALTKLSLSNSWYNISEKIGNNSMRYYNGNEWKSIKFEDGFYTLNSFVETLREKVDRGKKVNIEPDLATGKLQFELKSPYELSLDNTSEILGFSQLTRLSSGISYSTYPAKFVPITKYYIHCDALNELDNILNGNHSDILEIIDIKPGHFGDLVTYEFQNLIYLDLKDYVEKINLCITDFDGQLIDFNNYPVTYFLSVINE